MKIFLSVVVASPSRASLGWMFVALPAILLFLIANARGVSASCGDWLVDQTDHVDHGPAAATSSSNTMTLSAPLDGVVVRSNDLFLKLDPRTRQNIPSGRRACRGPACSKLPASPQTPSNAPTVRLDNQRWGYWIQTMTVLASDVRTCLVCESKPFFHSGVLSPLDRPPKFI